MSVTRRIAFGTGAVWLNRLVAVVLALVLIPVLFRRLPAEELGLWFLLAQAGAFVGLLDFGFTVTLTRRIAIVDAGGDEDSQAQLDDLVATGRRLYLWIAAAVVLVGLVAGYAFLSSLPLEGMAFARLMGAWAVLCVAYAITTESGRFHCALNGAGHVGWDAIVATAAAGLTAIAQICAVLLGGGLMELALAAVGGAIVGRQALAALLRRRAPHLAGRRGTYRRDLLRDASRLAWRAWLTALGGFMILKTDQYFIAYFRGAADIPAYHAAFQLVMNCYLLAVAFAVAAGPFVSRMWGAGDLAGVHRIVWRSVRLGLGLMVSAVAFLLVCGPGVIELWLGEGQFVGYAVLATFCVMLTLETQHVIVAHACRATEDEAFAPWALGAGALNLVLTWVLIEPLGLWGVALATLLAQLVTNNWYALWHGLRRLRMSARMYLTHAVLPVAALFAATTGVCWAAATAASTVGGEIVQATAGALAVGIVLAAFSWRAAFTPAERAELLARLRR